MTLWKAIRWAQVQGALLDALACAALGFAAGRALGSPRAGLLVGVLAGAALASRWTQQRAARAVERRQPELGSALQAFLEGQGGSLRQQLESWLNQRAGLVALPLSIGRAVCAGALLFVPLPPRKLPPAAVPAKQPFAIHVHVEPPAYAKLPSGDTGEPLVRALKGSRLLITATGEQVRQAEEGKADAPVTAPIELLLDRSRTLRFSSGSEVKLVQLEVLPDKPPLVELLEPAADAVLTRAPGPIALRAHAQDDFGLASLTLHWTLAQGHADETKFRSGRIAAPLASGEAAGTLHPGALGMKRGDTLVLWAEATDNNAFDGPGRARSEARIVRWDEPVVELSGLHSGAALPPPKSLLTERELLARTLKLLKQKLRGAALQTRSAELAADQRTLRSSFGFFLQGETQDSSRGLDMDDKELGESGDSRARRLLADAVSAMWEAESALSVGDPRAAVAPERAAVKALDAAFGLVRMALRPGKPPDKPLDESRRLSGEQKELRPKAEAAALRAGTESVVVLSRRLLIASEHELTEAEAKALGDELWALRQLETAPLAAALYSAQAADRPAKARAAGEALARWLRPSPIASPPVSAEESRLLAQVPAR